MMSKPIDYTHALHDLAVVEAMVTELEPYLKSDILYWQLSPAVPIAPAPPLLTLGGFLLRVRRLSGQQQILDAGQQGRLDASIAEFETVTHEWSVHVEQRLRRELKARLDSWQWFVEDCDAQQQNCVTYYATEAELRTVIEYLLEFGGQLCDLSPQMNRLRGLDGRLRRWFEPGEFVWRPDLEPLYPRERYWWLYGRPDFHRR